MATPETPPALADRAALMMRNREEGERYLPWALLTRMPLLEVEAFQAALLAAMDADPLLEVKALSVAGHKTGRDGLIIRWRRRG